jgi:uncharacterized repeat protein (TIGR01451 family)
MYKKPAKLVVSITLASLVFGLSLGLIENKVEGVECTPIYGGGEVCPNVQIDVDKDIARPDNGDFVENLIETDPKYKANNIIAFRIQVRNTGQTLLKDVKITDILPPELNFHSGAGRLENGKLVIGAGDLEVGESREFIIRTSVVSENEIVKTECNIVNSVEAKGKDNGNDVTSTDTTRFCIEKKVVEELPEAGAGSLLLLTASLTGVGIALRKYA